MHVRVRAKDEDCDERDRRHGHGHSFVPPFLSCRTESRIAQSSVKRVNEPSSEASPEAGGYPQRGRSFHGNMMFFVDFLTAAISLTSWAVRTCGRTIVGHATANARIVYVESPDSRKPLNNRNCGIRPIPPVPLERECVA